jgi:acyl carrier protein
MSDTTSRVYPIIAQVLCVEPEWVEPHATLADAPNADSLDIIELQMALEDGLGIALPDSDMDRVRSVEDLTKLVDRKLAERQPA